MNLLLYSCIASWNFGAYYCVFLVRIRAHLEGVAGGRGRDCHALGHAPPHALHVLGLISGAEFASLDVSVRIG